MKSKKRLISLGGGLKVVSCGALVGVVLAGGLSVSCKSESQADLDKKKLELVGYELNREGFFKAAAQDDVQALKIFKSNKFDINQRGSDGQSVGHHAAGAGAVRALSFLSKQGLEFDLLDHAEKTPLMLAAAAAELEAIEFLLKSGVSASLRDKAGKFALIYAVESGSDEAIRLLAPHARNLLDTALLYAADQNHAKAIKPLVQYGASVYSRNQGETSLMIAAERGNVKVIKALIQEGANTFAISDDGKLARDYGSKNPAVIGALLGAADAVAVEGAAPVALEWSEDELEEVVKKAMVRFHEPELQKFAKDHSEIKTPEKATDPAQPVAVSVDLPNVSEAPEQVVVQRLQGKKLAVDLKQPADLQKAVSMAGYAERPQAIVVLEDGAGKVVVRDLREKITAPAAVVEQGKIIGVTGLKVKEIKKKIVNSKMTGGVDRELITLVVEDVRNGKQQELYAGYDMVGTDAVAVVRMAGSGDHLIVKRGDVFYDANDTPYKVMDVSERELLVENTKTHEVVSLPLLGIKRN